MHCVSEIKVKNGRITIIFLVTGGRYKYNFEKTTCQTGNGDKILGDTFHKVKFHKVYDCQKLELAQCWINLHIDVMNEKIITLLSLLCGVAVAAINNLNT